jgi:hypothetical protein
MLRLPSAAMKRRPRDREAQIGAGADDVDLLAALDPLRQAVDLRGLRTPRRDGVLAVA